MTQNLDCRAERTPIETFQLGVGGTINDPIAVAVAIPSAVGDRHCHRVFRARDQYGNVEICGLRSRVPDALLQLDHSGRITAANGVFLQWIQEPSDRHVLGRNADDWLGRTGVDLQVLLDNLSQRSVVTRFASTLRTQAQGFTDIEISGSSRSHSSDNEYLLFLRDTSRRIHHRETTVEALPSSIEEITSRVGQTPLKDLVRESTDVIEALCIESALKLTRNNRASAAELLGLSRQSLYTKLRRFGIGETEIEAETG